MEFIIELFAAFIVGLGVGISLCAFAANSYWR